jgi:nucleotide-binding universal stress UspA family protein
MNSMKATGMFNRILVATNGSEKASAAVERGVELAATEHAELVFLHVLPPAVWRHSRLTPASATPRRLPAAPLHDEALRKAVARAREMGVEAKVELLSGNPTREIVSAATMFDADVVVIGEGGRNPLHEHVTPGLLRHSKRPVLVAKRREPQAAKGLPLRKAA